MTTATEITSPAAIPQAVRDWYAKMLPAQRFAFAGIFAWLEAFDDSMLSGGQEVQPLIKLAQQADTYAVLALSVLWNHHREPWLHDRMTFHALADLQSMLPASVQAFAREIAP